MASDKFSVDRELIRILFSEHKESLEMVPLELYDRDAHSCLPHVPYSAVRQLDVKEFQMGLSDLRWFPGLKLLLISRPEKEFTEWDPSWRIDSLKTLVVVDGCFGVEEITRISGLFPETCKILKLVMISRITQKMRW